jgi:4-diphosphocytidyl-2-C-methyl-D-erythritol kinase
MTDHTADSRTERAHAKINLLLRILARETSGYHGIETLFQRLALHDVVHVRVGAMAPSLSCTGPAMPAWGLGPTEKNLAWRAAQAYLSASGWSTGWAISIEKHIPVGGGLGGGSADAAAVLRALESMCPTPLGQARLLEIAGTLGADVPFMVLDVSLAWAWGRGDRLLPLPALPSATVWLATFPNGVNTGAAYGAFARAREARGEQVTACTYAAGAFATWESIAAIAANDFEAVVSTMHTGVATTLPAIRTMAHELRASGATAIGLLSGSGATCFVLHAGGSPLREDEEMATLVRRLTHTQTL